MESEKIAYVELIISHFFLNRGIKGPYMIKQHTNNFISCVDSVECLIELGLKRSNLKETYIELYEY